MAEASIKQTPQHAHRDHRRDYTVDHRLLLLAALAVLVGGLGTLAAFVLLKLIFFFTNLFFFQTLSLAEHSPAQHHLGLWVVLVPVLGGLMVGLMARFGSDKIRGHGIPEALEVILFGKSRMSGRVAVLKPLSSGIVIGSGGPFGAEGPIIMTGGALGSLLAQFLHLTAAERKTLLVAGACAGMTAIFGTPVAAVLLAVELLLFELRPRSLLPVAVACAVAGFARPLLLGAGPLFALQTPPATDMALVSCVIAGLLSGALAAVVTLALYKTEDLFGHLKLHWMWWPAIGGLVVGLGGLIEPRALGVGYDVIGDLLNNRLALGVVVALLTVKAVIWVAALGSGTSGGVLAPLLMIGAGLGVALAHVLPGGSPQLWALVCMAGVLASVLGAPLTAIVFAFGLTHDTEALLPLLLTTVVAYGFTALVLRRSIMTEKIARRGLHIYREYGIDPLESQHVADLMTRKLVTVDGAEPAAAVFARYFSGPQGHRRYPVVHKGRLIGMLEREVLRDQEHSLQPCAALFCDIPATARPEETARAVAGRMTELRVSSLPVVADEVSMRLVGVIALSDLLRPQQAVVVAETVRERLR
ncbi:chloride channel protein [Silvimonas iriomotensis]|uniref:Voltage-gated clc-type chloride channel n=1 Tax=Silvimonas iriomotensis TaxID=449662 RepID=A0ABQ2P741_9NEIS|nr:chloride channel protein [Silvimonas iriomotensis]GGP19899.1 voltage-gated clc-type chloride channel [Silvimonas iriomotensis]